MTSFNNRAEKDDDDIARLLGESVASPTASSSTRKRTRTQDNETRLYSPSLQCVVCLNEMGVEPGMVMCASIACRPYLHLCCYECTTGLKLVDGKITCPSCRQPDTSFVPIAGIVDEQADPMAKRTLTQAVAASRAATASTVRAPKKSVTTNGRSVARVAQSATWRPPRRQTPPSFLTQFSGLDRLGTSDNYGQSELLSANYNAPRLVEARQRYAVNLVNNSMLASGFLHPDTINVCGDHIPQYEHFVLTNIAFRLERRMPFGPHNTDILYFLPALKFISENAAIHLAVVFPEWTITSNFSDARVIQLAGDGRIAYMDLVLRKKSTPVSATTLSSTTTTTIVNSSVLREASETYERLMTRYTRRVPVTNAVAFASGDRPASPIELSE